jgi:hypothetical protein
MVAMVTTPETEIRFQSIRLWMRISRERFGGALKFAEALFRVAGSPPVSVFRWLATPL